MAKTTTKPRPAGKKPQGRYVSPNKPTASAAAPPAPKEEKPAPRSQDAIMADIVMVCDEFDAEMTKPRDKPLNFQYPERNRVTPLSVLRDRLRLLTVELDKDLTDEQLKKGSVDDLIEAALAEQPGIVPRWSRPGTFLVWIGFVPVRCDWSGFAFPNGYVSAADPTALCPWPSGMDHTHTAVDADEHTVDDLFRNALQRQTVALMWNKRSTAKAPAFGLHKLKSDAAKDVAEYLAANGWLRDALKRGPVNAIPLPKHIQAVQLALA
jgi:hypothetical protein